VRILHTSDFHLREFSDQRWESLLKVLELAEQKNADVLTIGGDLFDSEDAAEALHAELQNLFSGRSFKILIIPGNHDAQAFEAGRYFGESVIILQDINRPWEYGSAAITGLPFEELEPEELLSRLHEAARRVERAEQKLLLIHGELLDVSGDWENYGEEEARRYMPMWLSMFKDLQWDYILAGHFHSKCEIREISSNSERFFIYPGSPISLTKKEIGPRYAVLLEPGPGAIPERIELSTPYMHELHIELTPERLDDPSEELRAKAQALPQNAQILVSVEGYFDRTKIGMTEQELAESITQVASELNMVDQPNFKIADLSQVVQDQLYKDFLDNLSSQELDENKAEAVKKLMIQAMINANR